MSKIYVCDDDIVILMMVRKILGTQFQVEISQTIDGLIDKLEQDKPDLILLDFLMPECNGLEALAMLKEKGFYPEIPVVIVTGERDMALEVQCLNEGIEEFIQKPFVPDVLISKVKQVLARAEK